MQILMAKFKFQNSNFLDSIGIKFESDQCLCDVGDTCSWKRQLEKTRNWKVRHEIEKNEVGKFAPELESFG